MGKIRVAAFSVSLDGYGAGPRQDRQNPLGVRGPELFQWLFKTEVFNIMIMHGQGGGAKGINNDMARRSFEHVGAWILGRNMFGPIRGPWKDDAWKGWWGDTPPYHVPVFVLTHYARAPLVMKGGTTFYFVTDGIESALKQAKDAAQGKDVRIGGGVSTIRQYVTAGYIDELHLALSPVFMGEGEYLFSGINWHELGYVSFKTVHGERATHIFIQKKSDTHKTLTQ